MYMVLIEVLFTIDPSWKSKCSQLVEYINKVLCTHTEGYHIAMKMRELQFSHCRFCLFATPWTAALQASPSIANSQSLLKLMPIKSAMLSNHLILCHPLLLLLPIFPSIKVFSNESVLPNGWPKYWSFNFSISPSSEYSGWISFRMDQLIILVPFLVGCDPC